MKSLLIFAMGVIFEILGLIHINKIQMKKKTVYKH